MKTYQTRIIVCTIIFAAIELAIGSAVAHAADFEASVGESVFQRQPDSVWYQDPFQHQLNMRSTAWSLGLTGMATSNLRWRSGYAYLGHVSSDSVDTPYDSIYRRWGAQSAQHGPMASCQGSGDIQELYATIASEMHHGKWTFSVEGGAAIYRASWQVNAYIIGDQNNIGVMSHQPNLRITPMIGASIGYSDTSLALSLQNVRAEGDQYPGVYAGPVATVSVRQKF